MPIHLYRDLVDMPRRCINDISPTWMADDVATATTGSVAINWMSHNDCSPIDWFAIGNTWPIKIPDRFWFIGEWDRNSCQKNNCCKQNGFQVHLVSTFCGLRLSCDFNVPLQSGNLVHLQLMPPLNENPTIGELQRGHLGFCGLSAILLSYPLTLYNIFTNFQVERVICIFVSKTMAEVESAWLNLQFSALPLGHIVIRSKYAEEMGVEPTDLFGVASLANQCRKPTSAFPPKSIKSTKFLIQPDRFHFLI